MPRCRRDCARRWRSWWRRPARFGKFGWAPPILHDNNFRVLLTASSMRVDGVTKEDRLFAGFIGVVAIAYGAYNLAHGAVTGGLSPLQFCGIAIYLSGGGGIVLGALSPPAATKRQSSTSNPNPYGLWIVGLGIIFFGAGGFSSFSEALHPTVRGQPATDPGDILAGRIIFGTIALGAWSICLMLAMIVARVALARFRSRD